MRDYFKNEHKKKKKQFTKCLFPINRHEKVYFFQFFVQIDFHGWDRKSASEI